MATWKKRRWRISGIIIGALIGKFRIRGLVGELGCDRSSKIMLVLKNYGEDSFADVLRPGRGYFLSGARLEVPNETTAIFRALLNGPEGKPVWARAWLATEDGTLAEAASAELNAGDEVVLEVVLRGAESPKFAYMRIESTPLQTEHVVVVRLL